MKIGILKETENNETRVALTPSGVQKLVSKGLEISVEKGLADHLFLNEEQYVNAGATVSNRASLLQTSDLIARVRKSPVKEIAQMKKGSIHLSFLDPFNSRETVDQLAQQHITGISMEMIPRTTLAQKMDALSSQANLGGYVAVVLAAERTDKILPMMMTPSGTITPAHVFVIGAGVAGLQAIATAKRLGARVEAFDTRPVVEEQVRSLGAKFIKIDLGETGQTKDGYAKALTEEQVQRQRDGMTKVLKQSDIVITTAQLFGRKAPVIITGDMLKSMKPGSIIVDMAAESGGNVEGSRPGEDVVINDVTIIGAANLPGRVPLVSSEMFSNNIVSFIESYWNTEEKSFPLNLEDEILAGCIITRDGQLINETVKKGMEVIS